MTISLLAEIDLRNIIEYINTILGNKISASKQIAAFDDAISRLGSYPRINPKYEYNISKDIEIRRKIMKKYSIFYSVDDINTKITVLRVLYNGSDLHYQLLNTPTSLYLNE